MTSTQALTPPEVENMTVNGRYIIHEKIGEGGMGVVYRATDRLSEHILAFKQVIVPTWEFALEDTIMAGDLAENLRLALAHEFETLASLRHPNIISVLDYGFDEERRPYFTMDYVMGAKTILEAGKGLDEAGKIHLLQQTLQALAYLHRRGILHRDLKPANVLVTYRTVRILDFGLATTQRSTMQAAGSIPYIAPEVWEDEPHSEAADLYAVGIIAFELFAERHPFDVNSPQFLEQVLGETPDLSMVNASPEVTAVIGRLIEKTQENRYPTAEACIEALSQAIQQPVPAESIAIRESYLQAATFVGREKETKLLLDALEKAKEGQGSAWLVSGESGVGKTRLLDEIGTQALVQGALVLRGQAVEDVGSTPLQLWQLALRRLILTATLDDLAVGVLQALIPDIGRLLHREVIQPPQLDAPAARQRLISTITSLFGDQSQWILLILEDLHWAGAGLEILQQLTRLAPRLPLLIIGSYRNDEQVSLAEKVPLAEEIPLGRLSADEMAALSASMLGDVGADPNVLALLQRETEGNAFFLVEVVRALAEEAGRLSAIGQMSLPQQLFPQGIQTIVQRRLARVPQTAVPLLVGTAFAGRQLDLNLLAELVTITDTPMPLETWLATCAETAVLELFNGNWRFAHDKLRAGILETVTANKHTQWHQTIAEQIEKIYPNNPEQAAALTFHWHEAGNLAKEREYARQAGLFAQQQFLNQAAIEYYSRALELTPEEDLQAQFVLYLAREQIYHLQGKREEQQADLAALGQIAANLATQQDVDRRAEVALRLANFAEATGDYPASLAAAKEALRLALEGNDKKSEAASRLAAGRTLVRQGEYEAAQENLQRSLFAAHADALTDIEADTLRQFGIMTYDMGHLDQAKKYYEQSLPLYETLENKQGESAIYNNLSIVAISQGNIEQALVSLEKAQQIDEAIGDREGRARILTNLSSLYLDLGAYNLARQSSQEALNVCREIDVAFGECFNLINLSIAAHFLGDDSQAEQYSQDALALAARIGSQFLSGLTLKDRGFLLINQNKYAEAEEVYQNSVGYLAQTEQVLESRAGLAWLAMQRGDETAAKQHLAPILEHLHQGNTLDGTARPFYILLHTYKVLFWLQDPGAAEVLAMAYGRLVTWISQITNEEWQDSFLESVPVNLEIATLYESQE
ncbi:protein kinase domain-containing protein [Candidatus Leptofilum sp.]|uniref:protein kinase domain-containing protein n=1 Tax=Candidatus Leptofilum sp. TaxID=3241576 RepID=UPI003B5B03CA